MGHEVVCRSPLSNLDLVVQIIRRVIVRYRTEEIGRIVVLANNPMRSVTLHERQNQRNADSTLEDGASASHWHASAARRCGSRRGEDPHWKCVWNMEFAFVSQTSGAVCAAQLCGGGRSLPGLERGIQRARAIDTAPIEGAGRHD